MLSIIFFNIILFLISFLSNFISALAGGGAGLIQLPALIFLGLPFPSALATHKIASVALGLGATTRHLKNSNLRFKFLFLILLSGIPGVLYGAHFSLSISSGIASLLLGVLTLSIALYSFSNYTLGTIDQSSEIKLINYVIASIGLFFFGFLNGSLSSGTGLLVTLLLVKLYKFSFSNAISYTLIIVGIFWNASGAIVLGLRSPVLWEWIPPLIFGSLFGGYCGTHISILKGKFFVKRIYELVCLVVGTMLIFKSVQYYF